MIAGNSLDGVRVYQVPGTSTDVFSIAIIANNIHSNGNLGINLATDTTGSGFADADLGPNPLNNNLMSYPAINANYFLNRPTISSASFSGNQITINYDFQAPGVTASIDGSSLLPSNLVGFRLDFYLNDAGQDGAYVGYSQGRTHIGHFFVNGSEAGASHVFTSPVTPVTGQVITATTTAVWQNIEPCNGTQQGDGPPYVYCGP